MINWKPEFSIEELKERIKCIFYLLSPLEQKTISMRFGLSDNITHTLQEVGDEFDVTRERIRQIEAKVIEKAKHLKIPTPEELNVFLDGQDRVREEVKISVEKWARRKMEPDDKTGEE